MPCLAEPALETVLNRTVGDDETTPSDTDIEQRFLTYLAQARETFPKVRARFTAGLPSCAILLVIRRPPSDVPGNPWAEEPEAFVVEEFSGPQVTGHEWSGSERPDPTPYRLTFPESEVVDWLLAMPDGTIEGNWMAKSLAGPHDNKAP